MFTIHSALLAHQSPVLRAMVYGEFKEAYDCFVEWDDIDERTFTSFWQFVYTGDYDVPESPTMNVPSISTDPVDTQDETIAKPPDSKLAEEPGPKEPAPEAVPVLDPGLRDEPDLWSTIKTKPPKKKRVTKGNMLWNDFQDSWHLDVSVDEKNAAPEAQKRPEDHGDICVHHAQVYILADRYGITQLMNVSFQKLHQALVGFAAIPSTITDVVTLLRFCCAELAPEKLRQLVVHYAACKVETLWMSEDFQELLEESGSFSRALMGSVLLRLD